MKPVLNVAGQKFGKLTAMMIVGKVRTHTLWECLCECGGTTRVTIDKLRSGHTQSCGCLHVSQFELTRYRKPKMPEDYQKLRHIWKNMMHRCYCPDNVGFKYYGGRGIKVCDRWHSLDNFRMDMAPRPKGLTLDRINVNGNYEPSNCRWATWKEQANNKQRHLLAA